ncbi:MAG: hypothetical protein HOU01_04820 [Streptomycetaceae bacterium]|nr:hypothetical protein [Streptomycetaceae bacterium]
MAIAKAGSRRIVVDSVAYRWRLRGRPSYCQALGWTPCAYAVALEADPGAVLVVLTAGPHPSNWVGRRGSPVLPSDVARAVRVALERGWEPGVAGAQFRLDLSQGFVASP